MKKNVVTVAIYCALFLNSVYNKKEETHLEREPVTEAIYPHYNNALTFSGGTATFEYLFKN